MAVERGAAATTAAAACSIPRVAPNAALCTAAWHKRRGMPALARQLGLVEVLVKHILVYTETAARLPVQIELCNTSPAKVHIILLLVVVGMQ